jgi:hypothetical protein
MTTVHKLPPLPGHYITNEKVYDPSGNELLRYVLGRDGGLICIDTFELDDPNVPWTPVYDTEYKVNHDRQVRTLEHEQEGYVWIKYGQKFWCIAMLRAGIYEPLEHRNQ